MTPSKKASFFKLFVCSILYARADSNELPTTLWTFSENQSSNPKFSDIVAKTATIIAGDNAKIEKTEVTLR